MRLLIPVLCVLLACCKSKNNNVNIIPKPQNLKLKNDFFHLNFGTSIDTDSIFNDEKEYLKSIIPLPLSGDKNTINLRYIKGLTSEAYKLNISPENINILASTDTGIIRGIQTLRQLLPPKYEKNGLTTKIRCLEIYDYPRFKWRGMLLDCCRHFMSKEFIIRYIDLLAYHKMNVLHWHLTEDQGWRIEIEKYPQLINIGAWREVENGEKYGGYYSKEDINEILEYAKTRHITIVPEIEFPGHSSAAIASYPHLSCLNKKIKVATDWGVFKDIYCAGNDSVFVFMEDVLQEVIDLFPSKYIHIGGDEAPKYNWENCKKCQKRIRDEKLKDEHELQSYFINRISNFLEKNGKKLIGWDEILEGNLNNSATIQSWRGEEGGIIAAKNKQNAIMSPTSHCYFDYGLDAINLEKVYHYEPIPKSLNDDESTYILGAECNMWSERAPQEVIDSKVFPRLLAMSEVLWSAKEKDYTDFYARVQKHYKNLDAMGVKYGYENTPITSNIKFINNHFKVALEKGSQKMKIEYKINDNKWQEYKKPFYIESTSTIYARGVKDNREYGDFQKKIIKHIATGKKVMYANKYNKSYSADGDYSLTDGLLGSNNFRDGYYQGFFGDNLEVIIDLKKKTKISEIKSSFFQYHLSWIILPKEVIYYISEDGKKFTEIKKLKNDIPIMEEGKFKKTFELKKDNIYARYVKIKALNIKNLPKAHPAAGSKAWIFADEIIIN